MHRVAACLVALVAATSCVNGLGQGTGEESDDTPCGRLKTAVVDCYDSFCDGGGSKTAFCGCWSREADIDQASCQCVPRDMNAVCQVTTEDDFSCTKAETLVESICG